MIKLRGNMTIAAIWNFWQWHQHHVMPMALSIAPLYSLGQDHCTNVQHNFLSILMPLMLVSMSHNANSVIDGTILFVRSRWSKADTMTYLVIWCHWYQHQHHLIPMASSTPLHLFSQDDQNEVQCDILSFWSFDAIGTVTSVIWCQHHHQWHHCTTYVRTVKWGEIWLFGHAMPMPSASHATNGTGNGTWHWYEHQY